MFNTHTLTDYNDQQVFLTVFFVKYKFFIG